MKMIIAMCSFIFMVTAFSQAQKYQEWYKPFSSTGRGYVIHETCSHENRIWFFSDLGFGVYNTVTQKIDYTPYEAIELGVYTLEYGLALGDSDRVALYGVRGNFIKLYEGGNWRDLPLPEGEYWNVEPGFDYRENVFMDHTGTLWVVSDRSEIAMYRNDTWTPIPLNLPDSISLKSMVVDQNGAAWLLGNYRVIGEITPKDTFYYDKSVVYRYNDGEIEKISELPLEYYRLKYVKNTPLLYSENSISILTSEGVVRRLLDNRKEIESPTIDTDGNLWYIEDDQVFKYDIEAEAIIWKLNKEIRAGGNLNTCDNGIFIYEHSIDYNGFLQFADNDTVYTMMAQNMWDATCGSPTGSLLFRKDSSFLSYPTYADYSIGMSNTIMEYKNGSCSALPTPDFDITGMWELHDGTPVLARYQGGLYYLDGESWKLFEGTETIWCCNVIQDKSDVIWAATNTSIIRQNGTSWELINSSNSNLPDFGSDNVFGNNHLIVDLSGAVWLFASGDFFVAKTGDGYDWTVYDTTNSNIFSRFPEELMRKTEMSDGATLQTETGENLLGIALNRSGSVELDYLCPGNCDDSECFEIIRVTDNGSANWKVKTIALPEMPGFTYPLFLRTKRDREGGFWIFGNQEDDYTVYHNIRGSTNWKKYDDMENPFTIVQYLGVDSEGKTYFRDIEQDVVVFNPDSGSIDPNPVIQPLRQTEKITQPAVRSIANGRISVDFSLPKTTHVSISVISLNGKMVTQLHNGMLGAGNHRNSYSITVAPGIYLLRFQTPDKLQSSRIFIR